MKILVLAFCLTSSAGWANEAPPVPEGGLSFYAESPCSDNETGAVGYCYMAHDTQGTKYLMFWQGDTLMFIREVTPGVGYKTIWVNDDFLQI